jgi:hypothetical protein
MYMKKILYLFFMIPFLMLGQKKVEPNKKGVSKNKLDTDFTPKDVKVYGESKASSSSTGDISKNRIFFDIGPLLRSTVLIGYERHVLSNLSTNIQIGTSFNDLWAKSVYPEIFGNSTSNIPAASLLSKASGASSGLAFVLEAKLFINEGSESFFKLGYRHTGFSLNDSREWSLSLKKSNTYIPINVAIPNSVNVSNNFFYLGYGQQWEGSGNKTKFVSELSYCIGYKTSAYKSNYETKKEYAIRNGLTTTNTDGLYSSDENESVYTGGAFGSYLKTGNIIFLVNYRLGIGF